MAIVEQYTSRDMRITERGTVMTTIHKSRDGDLAVLPQIGEPFSAQRPDLVCQDIDVHWIDNVNNEVTINWSTRNAPNRELRADKVASTIETFNFSLESKDGSTFTDAVTEEVKFWEREFFDVFFGAWEAGTVYTAGLWQQNDDNYFECIKSHTSSAAGAAGDEPGVGADWETFWAIRKPVAPDLTLYEPRVSMARTVHVSKWEWPLIRDLVGTVNNADFIKTLKAELPESVREITYTTDNEDDTGHWLFFGADVRPVGNNDVEVSMEFLYSFTLWNEPHGVVTNNYRLENFLLLPQPTDPDLTQNNDLGRDPI